MNCSTPNMPRFEIVKVPPSRSGSWSDPRAGPLDELGAMRRDLGEREPLDRADHRHDEPLRRGDGDPDVRRREAKDRLLA